MKSSELPVPSESAEQQRLFQWARMAQGRYPELRWLYHVPNEGKRTRTTGARLAAEGLKRGVPDLCLPVARQGCQGLYIELKAIRGGRLSPEQVEWLDALTRQGYMAACCKGWEEAADMIVGYLRADAPEAESRHDPTRGRQNIGDSE